MRRNGLQYRRIDPVDSTFSAREAAGLFGRSHSWLDQHLRAGNFVRTDGTVIQPLRTRGNYRRFDLSILKEIAFASYRRGWFSYEVLRHVLFNIATAVAKARTSRPEGTR